MLTEVPEKKAHVIKHFQGSACHVFDAQNPNRIGNGIIEEVFLNDNIVCVRQGDESHYFDANVIYPDGLSFKDLKDEHLDILIPKIKFNGQPLDKQDLRYQDRYFNPNFILIPMGNHLYLYIHNNWNIVVKRVGEQMDIEFIDNMPEVIFTLCNMGFNVLDNQ